MSKAPPMRLLTLENVRQEVFPCSRASIYRMLKEGRFPQPVQINGRILWRADVLAEWVEENAPRHDIDDNATGDGSAQ